MSAVVSQTNEAELQAGIVERSAIKQHRKEMADRFRNTKRRFNLPPPVINIITPSKASTRQTKSKPGPDKSEVWQSDEDMGRKDSKVDITPTNKKDTASRSSTENEASHHSPSSKSAGTAAGSKSEESVGGESDSRPQSKSPNRSSSVQHSSSEIAEKQNHSKVSVLRLSSVTFSSFRLRTTHQVCTVLRSVPLLYM